MSCKLCVLKSIVGVEANLMFFISPLKPIAKVSSKSICAVFSGKSTKVSEELYDDVERFYLGYVYNQLETLRSQTDYIIGQGFRNKVETDPVKSATAEREERARIFGFNRSADLAIESNDEQGEAYLKEFKVKDINNPTQDELFDFAKEYFLFFFT